MAGSFNELIAAFDEGIKKREKGKFSREDVKKIYSAASAFFDVEVSLNQNQLEQLRDRWIELADGKIDKGNAMKKLQGTSRAEAIQSVLLSSL